MADATDNSEMNTSEGGLAHQGDTVTASQQSSNGFSTGDAEETPVVDKTKTDTDTPTMDPSQTAAQQEISSKAPESIPNQATAVSFKPPTDESKAETADEKESNPMKKSDTVAKTSLPPSESQENNNSDNQDDDPMDEEDSEGAANKKEEKNGDIMEDEAAEEDLMASDSDQDAMSLQDSSSLPKTDSDQPPPTLQRTSFRKRKRRRGNKLFQDCIRVEIPLDYTADLTHALRHTRQKRVQAIHQAFPMLHTRKTKLSTQQQADDDEDEDGKSSGKEGSPDSDPKSQRPLHSNGTDRQNYSSILDYLEAKYVKGVMIEDPADEGDGALPENDADERGSVYSESSFLDDTDLQRDVAEQVLAHSTATKIELQEDDGFFVNVGNLEVEESELTKEHYDPLEDIQKEKAKPVKVRKKPGPKPGFKRAQPTEKKTSITSPTSKSVASAGSKKSTASTKSGQPSKKKAKTAPSAGNAAEKKTPSSPTKKGPTTKPTAQVKKLTKAENDKKKIMEGSYKLIVSLIGKEDLPRGKTKEKVALTCPADKKPGDSILFENPHVQGQRLKVKIPKTCKPGGTFRVTVPVPPAKEGGEVDHNKWTREFYMALSDYAYHYDDWMDAKTERMAAMGQEFPGHFEKRKKFDRMITEFPKDLKTPIDKAYLQKILRRARQNKHKREKTAKIKQEGDSSGGKKSEPKTEESSAAPSSKEASSSKKSQPDRITLPVAGTQFPRRSFNEEDFA